jgi:hypothetical protein
MGGKTTIQAPPAPAPVDPAQSSADWIRAMSDPALQQQIYDAEAQYRPQYAQLELNDINTYLMGGGGQRGVLDLTDEATRRQNQLGIEALSQQRSADIGDVEALGQRASAAFMNANPELRAQMEANQRLQGGSQQDFAAYVNSNPDLLQNWTENASKNTQLSLEEYGRQHWEQSGRSEGRQVPMSQQNNFTSKLEQMLGQGIGRGQLGEQLYQDALGAGGLGQTGQMLDSRAQQFAQSTGALTPEEQRNLQQSVRGAYAARGTEMGSGAVSAEALARLTNERQRMQEDVGLASLLNQGSVQELGANRGFQQSVYGQDIARQQQNVSNFGALAQFQQGQLQNDRNYGLQLAAQQASVASDPFQAILGRPAQAPGQGMAQAQFAAGLAGQQTGPNLFNPDAGINLSLQNQSNQANYLSNIFGAQAGLAGAQSGAQGAMIGGGLAAAGGIGLAIF